MSSLIVNVNDETLGSLIKNQSKHVLLIFVAPWSSSCQLLEPALHEIASDYRNKVIVAKLNVDENAHTPAEFGIQALPHITLIENGAPVAHLSGPHPKTKISELLERNLGRRESGLSMEP